jgi:hypothetical protein
LLLHEGAQTAEQIFLEIPVEINTWVRIHFTLQLFWYPGTTDDRLCGR